MLAKAYMRDVGSCAQLVAANLIKEIDHEKERKGNAKERCEEANEEGEILMPLIKSKSKSAVGKNIEIEQNAGKNHDQAVAIALNTARKAGAKIPDGKTKHSKKNDRMGGDRG